MCLYRVAVEAFQPLLFSPPKTPGSCLLGGWKGFAQLLIDNHTKSVVGRVLTILLKFLLIIAPKARVSLVIFKGKHRKDDAELFSTFTEAC